MTGIFDILAPVIAMIAIGYALARSGILTPAGEAGLSGVVFYVTTPALMFRATAAAGPALSDLRIMAGYFLPCLLLYAAWAILARKRFGQGLGAAGLGAMGASFGNTVLLGVPIIERLHGGPGLRILVVIVSIHSAILFTLTTLFATADRGRIGGAAAGFLALRNAAANPIVLSIGCGALAGALGVRLPHALDTTLAVLGTATVPIALIAVGASLAGFALRRVALPCAAIAAAKLLALPLAVWISGRYVFALDPLTVAVSTLAAALPTGTNVHVLARRYAIAVETAAGVVLLSTLAAAGTIPLAIVLLGR